MLATRCVALVPLLLALVPPARSQDPSLAATTIPAAIAGSSTLIVSARINGSKPLWFILDSGANSCIVDEKRARSLKLRLEGQLQGRGAGAGTVAVQRVASPVKFELPGAEFSCERLYAIDLSNQPAILGREIDGILGYYFFARFVVEMDYDAVTVRLFDPATFNYARGGDTLPLTLTNRLPYMKTTLTVAGQKPRDRMLLVDTGSEDAVDDSLILLSTGPKRRVTGGVGLGQEYEVTFGEIDKVEIGRVELRNVPSVAPGVALVGSGVLKRFGITFDFSRQRIYLEPDPQYFSSFSSGPSAGIGLRGAGATGLRVHEVESDSPASWSGLETGDLILAIDGVPAGKFELARTQRLLNRRGSAFRLAIRRGTRQLDIVLRP